MKKQKKDFIDIELAIETKNPKLKKYLPRFIINYLKKIVHQEELNKLISENSELYGLDFLEIGLKSININYKSVGAEHLNTEKRYIFAANHPVGSIDGLALIGELGKYFGETRAVVNDLLLQVKNFSPLFIGVNKHGSNQKENIRLLNKTFNSNMQVIMFPAGLASRKIKGIIQDTQWKSTYISRAIRHQRNIVPVYISGQLSRRFYNLYQFRTFLKIKANLEMFFLVDEMFKQKNNTFNITFGKPISYKLLSESKDIKQTAEKMRKYIYQLAKNKNAIFSI